MELIAKFRDYVDDKKSNFCSLFNSIGPKESSLLESAAQALERTRPIPVSERLPTIPGEVDGEYESVFAYHESSDYWGEAWLFRTISIDDNSDLDWAWMNDRISGAPSHWIPKPPIPSETASTPSRDKPSNSNVE